MLVVALFAVVGATGRLTPREACCNRIAVSLGKLIVVERRIKAKNGALILVDLERELRDLFSLSFLDGLFVIREDRTAALAELLPARK